MALHPNPAMTDLCLETNPIMPEEKRILEEGEVFNCCQVLILDKYQDYIRGTQIYSTQIDLLLFSRYHLIFFAHNHSEIVKHIQLKQSTFICNIV